MSEPRRQRTAAQVASAIHVFYNWQDWNSIPYESQSDHARISSLYEPGTGIQGRICAVTAYLESVTLPPRWNPTTERPPRPGYYFVQLPGFTHANMATWNGEAWESMEYGVEVGEVKAWMELPPLPQEEPE